MYEMRSSSNLSILLGIDDISDAMRFAENLQQIAVSDDQLITEMHEKQRKLESQREEINAALDDLNAQQAELESTKKDVYKRQAPSSSGLSIRMGGRGHSARLSTSGCAPHKSCKAPRSAPVTGGTTLERIAPCGFAAPCRARTPSS